MTLDPGRTSPSSRNVPQRAGHGELAACLLLLAGAVLVPDRLRLLVVAAAFGAGIFFVGAMQARTGRPFDLRTLPRTVIGGAQEIGLPYLFVAVAALAVGLFLLLAPIDKAGDSTDRAIRPAPPPVPSPRVHVVRQTVNEPFKSQGVVFRVFFPNDTVWARDVRRRHAGRGQRWVLLSIRALNVSAGGFDPNRLAYRLRDARGTLYGPDVSGGTGPTSLGETGALERGEMAESRLGFRVPRSSRSLALLFEPRLGSAMQVEVSLSGKA